MSVECTLPTAPSDRHGRARVLWTALFVLGAVTGIVAGVRRCTRHVVVEGRSMAPALEPEDRLLVVRLPRRWPVRRGDVVAVTDPRRDDRLLVKRVHSASFGTVTLRGDNASESTDSRHFGPVARSRVWGRAVYRYAPAARAGRVGRAVDPRKLR